MQNLFDEVEKELPLLLERETDCRETWPKRWALLKYKVEKLKADNNERDVICSDSMCDYCTKVETCNGFEDAGDCFNGRKLTPVL